MNILSFARGSFRVRAVRACAALALAFSFPQAVSAATYYVRTDGGLANQCNGKADAAYPGTGSNQNCAWQHPFVALPPAGTPRIAGGDTLVIGSGSYMMGLGAPDTAKCYAAGAYDCFMPSIPKGISATQKTRILGKGFDAGCPAAPELWGTERASKILNLEASSNVEVACLEVTDHSDCIEFHCAGGTCTGGADQIRMCKRDTAPFGTWASSGISAKGASNVVMSDVNVHGLAGRGFIGGGLSNIEMKRVKLNANGWAGWEGDVGTGSSNSGTIALKQVEIGWNGCTERYPTREIFGCWAQQGGGYGDGIGTAATGGHWLIEDSHIHHNTSDGLDLLYADGTGSVTVRRTYVDGNAGNQLKTNGNTLLENNVVVGNCAYFNGKFNMQTMDQCRALGNAISVGMKGTTGEKVTIRNNTVTSEGDCLILSSGGRTTSTLEIQSNILLGALDFHGNRTGNVGELSCAHYADASPAVVKFTSNVIANVKAGQCPAGSVCANPQLANQTLAAFDAMPLATSPALNASASTVVVADDFYKTPRPQGGASDIGAVELASSTSGTGGTGDTSGTGGGTPPPPSCPDNAAVIAQLKAQIAALSATVDQIK